MCGSRVSLNLLVTQQIHPKAKQPLIQIKCIGGCFLLF